MKCSLAVAASSLALVAAIAPPAQAAKPVPTTFVVSCTSETGATSATSAPRGTQSVEFIWIYPQLFDAPDTGITQAATYSSGKLSSPFQATAPTDQDITINYFTVAGTVQIVVNVTRPSSVMVNAFDRKGQRIAGTASPVTCV